MRGLWAVGLLLLAGCVAPDAQDIPVGRIEGSVLAGGQAQPVGNASVELVELGAIDVSNDLGGFRFAHVAPGTYTLRVVDGDLGVDTEVVEVEAGKTVRIILQLPGAEDAGNDHQAYGRRVHTAVALPGHECECSWQETLDPMADSVLFQGQWRGRGGEAQGVEVRILDASREPIIPSLWIPGSGEIVTTSFPGHWLPEDGRVVVEVHFPQSLLPEVQFGMETSLWTTKAVGTAA